MNNYNDMVLIELIIIFKKSESSLLKQTIFLEILKYLLFIISKLNVVWLNYGMKKY